MDLESCFMHLESCFMHLEVALWISKVVLWIYLKWEMEDEQANDRRE